LFKQKLDETTQKVLEGQADKIIEEYGGKFGAFYESPVVGAVIQAFTPVTLSVNRDAYRKQMSEINSTLRRLQGEIQELNRSVDPNYRGNRSSVQIESSISDMQGSLEYNIDLANGYYQGIVTERELPESECYEVLESSHRTLIGLAARVAHMKIAPTMQVK
jgi:hypothetical protein